MAPGDLISTLMLDDVLIYQHWGSAGKPPPVIGRFKPGEVGILLEDGLERGGNGVKILTSSGIVGWMYRSEVDVVE